MGVFNCSRMWFCDRKSVGGVWRTRWLPRIRSTTRCRTGARPTTHRYLCRSREAWRATSSRTLFNKLLCYISNNNNSNNKVITTTTILIICSSSLRKHPAAAHRYLDQSASWEGANRAARCKKRRRRRQRRSHRRRQTSGRHPGEPHSTPVDGVRSNQHRRVLVDSNHLKFIRRRR